MSKLDTALTTFVLLVYIGALTPSQLQENSLGQTDPAGQLLNFLTVLAVPLVAILIVRHWTGFLATLRSVTWPVYLTLLVVLSTFWSINPGITFRRSIVFLVPTAFAIYLGSLGPEIRDRFFGRAVVFTIVASYILIAFFPSYGISGASHTGEWRGVFDHKNIMGRQMVFAFFLALYSQAFERRLTAWIVAALALFLLIMSRSGTGASALGIVLIFAGMLAIHSYLARRQITPLFWFVILPAFLSLAVFGLTFKSEIFQLLGKDESLTGRTTIWAVVFEGIAKKPYFGWGYDSFFTQRELRNSFGAVLTPNHSHNGFFDVVLATGFFGLAIFLIGFLIAIRRAWQVYTSSTERSARWPLIFLVILIFVNLTESNLLRKGTFMWIPYVALALWGMKKDSQIAAYSEEASHHVELAEETVSA